MLLLRRVLLLSSWQMQQWEQRPLCLLSCKALKRGGSLLLRLFKNSQYANTSTAKARLILLHCLALPTLMLTTSLFLKKNCCKENKCFYFLHNPQTNGRHVVTKLVVSKYRKTFLQSNIHENTFYCFMLLQAGCSILLYQEF